MAKQGYHHGNLKQALVDAALRLIETRGPSGFTLSEAAKQAGVTPAAVYRHFAGRNDLIAEAARQGYVIFADAIASAHDRGPPCARGRFDATCRAYLGFARQYPGHYVAMFESGLPVERTPELALAAGRARALLDQAADALRQHIPPDRRPPPEMFSAHIRAMSHGVVELFARQPHDNAAPLAPEDLLETGIGIYLRGLGLDAPDS